MNLVRSSIVPHTIASDTAQNTNSKKNLAAAGAVEAAKAGRFIVEPGLNDGAKPLKPIRLFTNPLAAPNANANPSSQYTIELMLRLTMILATTVPTFFMRVKPTSSMANPACMKSTSTAATITQTVSAATPAADVAVVSAAWAVRGRVARAAAPARATLTRVLRCKRCPPLTVVRRTSLGTARRGLRYTRCPKLRCRVLCVGQKRKSPPDPGIEAYGAAPVLSETARSRALPSPRASPHGCASRAVG